MAWIKRNLFFVVGAVVSLALLVFAGLYTYTGWKHNVGAREDLNKAYEELKRLYNQPILPGGVGKVDNVRAAREQQREIRNMLAKAAKNFRPIPAIPGSANVTGSEFQSALRRTIEQLTREAATASVLLPQDYKFSFYQQFRQLNFAPGSLGPLAVQLGEVKALCDVLINAKVNYIDLIQRERVSPDDYTGPVTDYINMSSQSNGLAVWTPYEITFRSFSPEIARVLAGFANSPHGIIVQSIEVKPAMATAGQPVVAPGTPYVPQPVVPPSAEMQARRARYYQEEMAEARALRPDLYGPNARPGVTPPPIQPTYTPPSPTYTPTPSYTPTTSFPAPIARGGVAGAQTVLNERQLQITLLVQVVKLLPKA